MPIKVEIHTEIPGVEFKRSYPRRIRAELDGVVVDLISLEDFKINKAACGRARDLADLENLP